MIKAEEDMYNFSAKLLDKNGNPIGDIVNIFSQVSTKDYIFTLFNLIVSSTNDTKGVDLPVDLKSTLVLETAEFARKEHPSNSLRFLILPLNESVFRHG